MVGEQFDWKEKQSWGFSKVASGSYPETLKYVHMRFSDPKSGTKNVIALWKLLAPPKSSEIIKNHRAEFKIGIRECKHVRRFGIQRAGFEPY